MKSPAPANKAINKLFFLLICLSALAHPADAAYKIRLPQADTSGNIIAGRNTEHIVAWQHVPPPGHQDRRDYEKASIWSNKEGIVSFAAGIVAATLAMLLLALVVELSPVIAILGIASATVAIISGAKGRRKRPRGFAVAGMWLGIAVLAGAVTLALGLALLLLIL